MRREEKLPPIYYSRVDDDVRASFHQLSPNYLDEHSIFFIDCVSFLLAEIPERHVLKGNCFFFFERKLILLIALTGNVREGDEISVIND